MACGWFSSGRARQQAKAQATDPPDPPSAPPPPIPVSIQPLLIRVTDERDGDLLNRGYSYWSQACRIGGYIYLFVGHADGHPRFFEIHEETGAVVRKGSLLAYVGTGEGLYWDAAGWIYLCEGPRLRRVNPFTGEDPVVFQTDQPGCRLWQAHSSDDGQVHSATVQQIVEFGPYPNIGTIVSAHGERTFYAARGVLDESQVDASGQFLIIKDNDDNLVIDLQTWTTRTILDADGAVGHSDVGAGFVVGEDNIHGQCVQWDLATLTKRDLFPTWSMGHVSVRGDRILVSDAVSLFLVHRFPEGGPTTEQILKHGMVSDGTYDTQVFGNLSPDGSVVTFLSNKEGRMDAYILIL